MTRVFVYGTLLQGFGNNRILQNQEFLGAAETEEEFTLLNLTGFPGLMGGGGTAIRGEVYEVDDACLEQLDHLEGANVQHPESGLYRRLDIVLADGQEVMTYCINWEDDDGLNAIESGDWREHVSKGKARSYCG